HMYAFSSLMAPTLSPILTLFLHDALPIYSSICFPSESQKDFISPIFSEKKVTTALIAFVTLSFIKLKPDFIESTTYNTVSLVVRSEEHTSELQSRFDLVCLLLLEKKIQSI